MYNIDRFVVAQKMSYKTALDEIKGGFKQTHWIWYIFPQLKGLGKSQMSEYYGIENADEAMEYWHNEYLKNNLIEISEELLKFNTSQLSFVIGDADAVKVRSCMTLFHFVAPGCETFNRVIKKFFNGEWDHKTFEMLREMD